MKILVLPSWYPKDSIDIRGSFFREQAIALRRKVPHVGVIAPLMRSLRDWRTLSGSYGLSEINDEDVITYRWHGMAWFSKLPQVHSRLWVRRGMSIYKVYAERYGKPDLVHAHSMLNAGLLAYEIKHRYGIPYVLTEHSTVYARGLARQWQIFAATKIAQNAAARFAVSTPFCDLLTKRLGCRSGGWQTMPNIVSKLFSERLMFPSQNQRSGFTFATVAILTEKKGVHHLIAAFAKAFHHDSSVALRIGGDGPDRNALKGLARKLGVAGRVCFLGTLTRQQVMEEMAAADAFVLASLYETFGVVVIEALALGKPVIATTCGGPEDIVRVEDGLLVPPSDVQAMARAMQDLRSNYTRYKSQEIRDECIRRFGEKAVVERLVRTYEAVV